MNPGKGAVAIQINSLLDSHQKSSVAGPNLFNTVTLKNGTVRLSVYAKPKTPAGNDSKDVYAAIQANIESWIEDAVTIRKNYKP